MAQRRFIPNIWAWGSDPRGLTIGAALERTNSSRLGVEEMPACAQGPLQSSPNPSLPPSQLPSDFPALQSRCQPGPFKDIPEGVVSVTSARGMNEQERVLTQLPLRTWGRRGRSCPVAGGRASGQERDTEAGVRTAEIARSERRGMELRAAGFCCLALLWGCALAAAAAQGKEGECPRGGRSQQGPRATGPRALEPHAPLQVTPLETDLWLLGLGALGLVGRAGCSRDNLGGPPPGIPGSPELRDLG